jgi:hypothetical protein
VIADAVATETTACDVSLTPADEGLSVAGFLDWRYEVANGDTNLSYSEWLEHKAESDEEVEQQPDRDMDATLADTSGPVQHPRADWRYEVANGDTNLSYSEWLKHKAESNESVRPNIDHMTVRRHVSGSPVMYTVAFPNFGDDARDEVRSGLESGENDIELASLISVARTMGITWNDPFDPDARVVDRSAEPQDTTSVQIREALESEDDDAVWQALVFLADEYEVSYTDPDEEAEDDRLCGCGRRHAIHVD